MVDSRNSASNDCIFVLPASDDVELLLDYNGLEWSNETINEERLRAFSDNCSGINISFFENANGKILMFSQGEEDEDSLDIYIERVFMDSIPCAFFDKASKTYDNFELPSSITRIYLKVDANDGLFIEWEFEEADDESSEICGELDDESSDVYEEMQEESAESCDETSDVSSEELRKEIDELTERNEVLEKENLKLIHDKDSLLARISELEEQVKLSTKDASPVSETEKEKEINELNRLIRQLADDRFKDYYVETVDSDINALTSSIEKQRTTYEEKQKSKSKLEEELATIQSSVDDVRSEISSLMDSIHKAESIQKELSTDVSDKQRIIQDLLEELDMDLDTLMLYSLDSSTENIVLEAKDLKRRLEEKLKSLVQERQNDCDERTNRIKGSS